MSYNKLNYKVAAYAYLTQAQDERVYSHNGTSISYDSSGRQSNIWINSRGGFYAIFNSGADNYKGYLATYLTSANGFTAATYYNTYEHYIKANNYSNQIENGTFSGNYRYEARFIILGGQGGAQDRIILFGKKVPSEPKADVTKHIKSVTPEQYVGTIENDYRLKVKDNKEELGNLTWEEWKKNNKLQVGKDTTITYEINIKNARSIKLEGSFEDTYDNGLTFVSIEVKKQSTGTTITFDKNNPLKANFVLPKQDDYITIEVKLKATGLNLGACYKNTAKVEYNNKIIISSDYITPMTPQASITKHIQEIDKTTYKGIIGTERFNHRSDGAWKYNNIPSFENDTTVTYQIWIENKENCKLEGIFTDEFYGVQAFTGYLSNDFEQIEIKMYQCSNGCVVKVDNKELTDSDEDTIIIKNNTQLRKFKAEVSLPKKEDYIMFEVKLKIKYKNTERCKTSIFQNTAKFTYIDNGEYITSVDFFKPLTEDIIINKSIKKIDGKDLLADREALNEISKANYPVKCGLTGTEHQIQYKIVIENTGTKNITGTFEDEYEYASFTRTRSTINPGTNITIPAGDYVEITFTLKSSSSIEPGDYPNTAKFRWNDEAYGEIVVESSDWVTIEKSGISDVGVKKYIKSITKSNSTPTDILGRDAFPLGIKDTSPVEVEQGDIVTYVIELKNNVEYYNKCPKNLCNGGGARCEHYDKNNLDWLSCVDIFDDGLAYDDVYSYTGNGVTPVVNGNKITFKWQNVAFGETVKVEFALKVTSSNMKKVNLENKVADVKYQFTWTHCILEHAEWRHNSLDCQGHHDPTKCKFSCLSEQKVVNDTNPQTIAGVYYPGTVDGTDSDFVRLLDPVISGVVWLENQPVDGLKKNGESIKNMTNDDHKKVLVELYLLQDGESTLIDSQYVNENGEFNFGRVRKGTDAVGTREIPVDIPYTHVPTGRTFKYLYDELNTYYIVYYYNGERYEATVNSKTTRLDTNNHYKIKDNNYKIDSNAEEIDREGFNNSLETISNDMAYAGTTSASNSKVLAYDVSKIENGLQVSTLRWDGDLNNTTTANVTMKARSFNLYVNGGVNGDDTEYLKYINLGLFEREKADLTLTKDVVKAEVTINGHKTTYNYDGFGTGNHVANSNNVLKEPYVLSLYREDYEYRTSKYDETIQSVLNQNNPYKDFGRDNDLNIILTYKITVTNNSEESSAVIRELIDYSSKELELLNETVTLNGNRLQVNSSSGFSNKKYSSSEMDYNQHFIRGDYLTSTSISANGSIEVFASYRVLKDDDGYILRDNLEEKTEDSKVNFAEIGAYSLYKNSKPSGLVDKNSNPGNIELKIKKIDTTKFEDDTFGTGILIVLKDVPNEDPPPTGGGGKTPPSITDSGIEKYYYRNISGCVFEEIDKSVNNKSDGQKVGDGIKNGNDQFAKNVLVKLYEVVQKKDSNGNVEEEYYVDTGLWYRTKEDGKYYFGDETKKLNSENKPENPSESNESTNDCYVIHPGLYVVRFVYGDEAGCLETEDGNTIRYSGQDYQSTKYTEVGSGSETEIIKPTKFTQKTSNNKAFDTNGQPNLSGTIYSVAKDNEVRRLEVNSYSTTITNPMDTTLKGKQKDILVEHTAMFADTKTFDLDIEYYDNYTNKTEMSMDGKITTIENYYYSVRDVDFGLIERPKVKLQLMNDISEITAITSDGNTLLDIFFDIEYTKEIDKNGNLTIKHTATVNQEKSKGAKQVQALNRKGSNLGYRYVNIDRDLLQGMTIILKYRIAVANISEVDHIAGWLETEVEDGATVDLAVDYDREWRYINSPIRFDPRSTGVKYGEDLMIDQVVSTNYVYTSGAQETRITQTREYNYSKNNLYKIVYKGYNGSSALVESDTGIHNYGTGNTMGSNNVKKVYTYTNIKNKANSDYEIGYYLGNIYYNNVSTGNEAKVKARVDKYIDYVDEDLVFKAEENQNTVGQIKYESYDTETISKQGLLSDVTDEVDSVTNGKAYYYTSTDKEENSKLALNVEDEDINPNFYRFLEPITLNGSDMNLYTIDLQASKFLTSEVSLGDVDINNIAEIVKSTNTVGRKIYVKDDSVNSGAVGFVGNTTQIKTTPNPSILTSTVEVTITPPPEIDTDLTELVVFSPPTGLSQEQSLVKTVAEKTGNVLLIIVPVIIIISGMGYVTVQVIKRKKFYK